MEAVWSSESLVSRYKIVQECHDAEDHVRTHVAVETTILPWLKKYLLELLTHIKFLFHIINLQLICLRPHAHLLRRHVPKIWHCTTCWDKDPYSIHFSHFAMCGDRPHLQNRKILNTEVQRFVNLEHSTLSMIISRKLIYLKILQFKYYSYFVFLANISFTTMKNQ